MYISMSGNTAQKGENMDEEITQSEQVTYIENFADWQKDFDKAKTKLSKFISKNKHINNDAMKFAKKVISINTPRNLGEVLSALEILKANYRIEAEYAVRGDDDLPDEYWEAHKFCYDVKKQIASIAKRMNQQKCQLDGLDRQIINLIRYGDGNVNETVKIIIEK
jgi:hypothetical protein